MWRILIIAILTALLGSSLFFFCIRKLKQRWSHKGSMKAEKLKLRRFQLEELEKATKNFSANCLLGCGAFGNVYKGTFEVEGMSAIKRAHAESYQSVEEFRNGSKGAKIFVYEYVPHGSLLEYIIGRGGRNLTWRQRVNIAIGAAKGIAHLHDGIKPSIIHRDIKPRNILIGDGFEAKVSDFGLVKLGPIADQSHARPGIESGCIEEILDTSLLSEPCNMEMMLKMGELGLRCAVKMPKDRPTMTQVWQELEDTLHSVDNFINKQPSRKKWF